MLAPLAATVTPNERFKALSVLGGVNSAVAIPLSFVFVTGLNEPYSVLSLEVTPQITPEGSIILDLAVNKDSPGTVVAGAMSIDTKRVKTQVLVENGGTVVIGGIFELTEKDSVAKVPLLGDIPVVGNLFKNRTRSSRKEEILVFITPKIISDQTALR